MEKERRTKALLLSTLVVVVATLSIAFAAMSRTLSINGIAKMDTASWSVYFDNLSSAKTTRGAEEVGKPNISVDKGTVENIKVKLSNPKDEISYTVDIVNDGTIDAEITMIKDIELTEAQKKIFDFKVTYTSNGKELKNGDLLAKNTTKNITITIRFKDDIEPSDLPSQSQTINLSYQVTYTQYDGNTIVIGPNGDIVTGGGILAATDPEELFGSDDLPDAVFFGGTIKRNKIESIDFLSSLRTEVTDTSWDASQNRDGSVKAWYTDVDNDELYELYVGANGKIYAPDCIGLFAGFINATEINFNGVFDTTGATDMSYMFSVCESLTTLDLSSFDTSSVTSMFCMFSTGLAAMQLTSINFSGWDTSNVTNMGGMFSACEYIETLDLSGFVTTSLTNISYMFEYCYKLKTIDFRNADFTNVSEYEEVFEGSTAITQFIVKDTTQKNLMISRFSDVNFVTVSEL